MKTCTRRFILRLIVGLLTFLIGVAAAMLLGGFRPFQSFASSPNYIYRRGVYYNSLRAEPAFEYEYGEHGCGGTRHRTAELPPPPPMADAPLPPEPLRPVR